MDSNIISDTKGIIEGVKLVTDLIRPTYGGAGTNVIIESTLRPGHLITNDANTIVQSIKVKDPAMKRGVGFMQELCNRADKMSGDNRKTTIILADEILKEGNKIDVNKLQLKKELDELIPVIEKAIDEQTKEVSVDEIGKVATTASENSDTGALLQEIYQQIGKDGIIDVEGSGTFETSYKITNGIKFEMAGYLSSAMANSGSEAIYENPLILVTKKKITTDNDINPLLWEMEQGEKKDLIIFTNDMDSGVASMLVALHKSKKFNILIIKAPSLWQDFYFEDFAKCTGATIVEDATGLNLRQLPFSALGTCGKITVDAEDTTIIGTADISEHLNTLEAKGDEDSKLRLSWLNNKTAKIKLGSNSDTDLSYKLLKCKDAIRSCHLALKYGVVAGGGVCALNVSTMLPDTTAGRILSSALRNLIEQIVENSNFQRENGDDITTIHHFTDGKGLNAKTMEIVDMFEAGIIDSSMTLKTAVRNAIGIASTILTASSYVYIPQLSAEEMQYQIAMSQHNAF